MKGRAGALFRSLAGALSVLCTLVGAFVLTVCIAAAVNTVASGFPALFGTGYMLYSSADGSELPDGTLIAFEQCSASDIPTGEWAVYRSARGMRAGVVVSASDSHIALRTSGTEVTAVPHAAVLGRATEHYPGLGAVLSALADARTAGIGGGLTVAFLAFFLLLRDLGKDPRERDLLPH